MPTNNWRKKTHHIRASISIIKNHSIQNTHIFRIDISSVLNQHLCHFCISIQSRLMKRCLKMSHVRRMMFAFVFEFVFEFVFACDKNVMCWWNLMCESAWRSISFQKDSTKNSSSKMTNHIHGHSIQWTSGWLPANKNSQTLTQTHKHTNILKHNHTNTHNHNISDPSSWSSMWILCRSSQGVDWERCWHQHARCVFILSLLLKMEMEADWLICVYVFDTSVWVQIEWEWEWKWPNHFLFTFFSIDKFLLSFFVNKINFLIWVKWRDRVLRYIVLWFWDT